MARRLRDVVDRENLYLWLKDHNPFSTLETRLKSLSTGITVDSGLNCDDAERIGAEIHKKLDGLAIADAKVKRKDRMVCLDAMINSINVGKKYVPINPTLLFNRLSALAGREENVEKFFDFELTTYPMSLFKDGLLRKPDKASLRKVILAKETSRPSNPKKVIDEGHFCMKYIGQRTAHIMIFWIIMLERSESCMVIVMLYLMAMISRLSKTMSMSGVRQKLDRWKYNSQMI